MEKKGEPIKPKQKDGTEIYRILTLYEDRRGVPPAHYLALMVLGEVKLVDVVEDKRTHRLMGQITRKGRDFLNERRRRSNSLMFKPSPH